MGRTDGLTRSRAHAAAQTPYDRLLHVAGVPREHWAVKREHVEFRTFRAERTWRQDRDTFAFAQGPQTQFFDDLLGGVPLTAFAGQAIMLASEAVDGPARAAASLVVARLLEREPEAVVVWRACTDVNPWGRPVGPADELVPDIVVLDGLHGDPTRESYEAVDRWRRWACQYTACLLVGVGQPIDLAIRAYRFVPAAALYCSAARAETHG